MYKMYNDKDLKDLAFVYRGTSVEKLIKEYKVVRKYLDEVISKSDNDAANILQKGLNEVLDERR